MPNVTAARTGNNTGKRPAQPVGRFSCWLDQLLGYIPCRFSPRPNGGPDLRSALSKRGCSVTRLITSALAVALVLGSSALADTVVSINHGIFGEASHKLVSSTAANNYKANADAIGDGTFVSTTLFTPEQVTLLNPDLTSGGEIYVVTTITGLLAGDIVKIDNNYLYNAGGGFASYWDQSPYWLKVQSYTHSAGDTIQNWLIYGEPDNSTFTLVIGSGLYNTANPGEDLSWMVGDAFRLDRDIEVVRGGTLVNQLTSSRGYKYSNTGVTGGQVVAADGLAARADIVAVVPLPPAAAGGLALMGGLWIVRRMRRR